MGVCAYAFCHVCMYKWMYIVRVYMCEYVCVSVHMCMCIYVHVCMHVCVYVHVCEYVCECGALVCSVCVHVNLCTHRARKMMSDVLSFSALFSQNRVSHGAWKEDPS